MPERPERPTARSAGLLLGTVFATGLLLALAMVARSQVGGDQLNLLARGWLLAEEGRWISHGNPLSTGGNAPGGLTSLLVGLPLLLWRDHRAPALLILACHVGAYLLLDRVVREALGPRARIPLALLYWLNPWRLYFSAFLWNPNYLFLFGALHLWATYRQRRRAAFFPSLLLAGGLVLACQIHPSTLLLLVATALLWLRGRFRLHWPGAALGFLLANLPLVPWYAELGRNPAIADASKGFLGRGLLYGFPLLRGLLYWLRYPSLSLPDKMARFDFTDALGAGVDAWLAPAATVLAGAAGITLLLPALANWRLAAKGTRWLRHRLLGPARPDDPPRLWLQDYVLATFAAAVAVFALAPTTIMMWQALVILHAAVLPALFWLGALLRTRRGAAVRRGLAVYAAVEVLLLLAIAFGSPQYRCAGRQGVDLALRGDHPMLHELHIVDRCPLPLSQPDGWWPDVLPLR